MKVRPVLAVAAIFALWTGRADARHKECIETGDTVGETSCRTYGSRWSLEQSFPFTSRFGIRYGSFSPRGVRFNDNTKRSQAKEGYDGYFFRGDALGVPTLTGIGPDGGVTMFLGGTQLYIGLEGGFVFGSARTATFQAGKYQLRDSGRGIDVMLMHAGAPIGYRIPLGRAHLRAEIMAGGTMAVVSHDISGPSAPGGEESVGVRWLLEPRVAADIWLTQHLAIGAYAGINVADSGVPAMGLSFSFHNRAFDGDWSLW